MVVPTPNAGKKNKIYLKQLKYRQAAYFINRKMTREKKEVTFIYSLDSHAHKTKYLNSVYLLYT